jgi:hypothetical protein
MSEVENVTTDTSVPTEPEVVIANASEEVASEALNQDSESPAEVKKKGDVPKGVAKRFSELTQQREQEKLRALRAETELAELRQKLEQAQPKQRDTSRAPSPQDFPGGKYDPDYQTAVLQHEVAKARSVFAEEFQRAEVEKTQYQKRVELAKLDAKAVQSIPDYAEARDFLLADPVLSTHPGIGEAVLEQDDPTALIYYLGTHPDEAYELADLSPTKAAIRIGKILERMESSSSEASAAKKPVSKAPAPAPKVGSGGTAPPTASSEARSMEEYVRLRNAELKGRR